MVTPEAWRDLEPMVLHDTARGELVPFEPGAVVTMYTCGITPYDATHLGHAAVYLTYDVLQRRLRDRGHDTRCVRNITDEKPPLSSEGYIGRLYAPQGRYWYVNIAKSF